ncbi:hypothetical protein IKE80_02635 [Candidatus Saccharibacteria bacterium]|nr:hypothetical protein [Candidatus Saccharibacteria bacterium]MBR2841647.1 hypothetical protein [Candidatus Saccharibacteria bacterium]MBR2998673.1 hypothetical protein [Candidatus Saccharibacteria bacterium]
MNRYPESNQWQDDYPDDDWDFLGPDSGMDSEIEAERTAYAAESLNKYMKEDTPDHPWRKVVPRQLNPNVVGTLCAIFVGAALTLDVVVGGNPSDLVVDNSEAAMLGLAAVSGVAGAVASKLTRDANAEELNRIRREEREQRKEESERW